jgi:hypothetical protein
MFALDKFFDVFLLLLMHKISIYACVISIFVKDLVYVMNPRVGHLKDGFEKSSV